MTVPPPPDATPQYETMVGERIRDRRKARRMTLRDLAKETGLSVGFLSQLERGVHGGSIKTLQLVSAALGVSVGNLFDVGWNEPPTVRDYRREHGVGFSNGAVRVRLVPQAFKFLEVFVGTLQPHASTSADAYVHGDSEEFLMVIKGSITLELACETFELNMSESIHYDSKTPHRIIANDEGAEVLWVISPPSY